jgi:3-oxoacyl-[acyl-carrier protein] reductase
LILLVTEPLHIWITGGSKGIGAAIAELLSTNHNITVSSRSGVTAESIHTLPNVSVVPCDVTNTSSIAAAVEQAEYVHGPIDVLINCAGTAVFKPLLELSENEFDAQIDTNLRGVFFCIKAVLPSMISRNSGMICTLNSISTQKSFPSCTAYGASKSGALALTRSLREEVRASGVKIVDFIVGATATDIWPAEAIAANASRMMKSSDIATSVAYVIEQFDHPRMITEEIIIRPLLGDL